MFINLDSGCKDYEHLNLTTSSRGNIIFDLKV